MHEEYLYGDISLHFSYHAQCLAYQEQRLKPISDLSGSGFHKSQSPPVCLPLFLTESNYKMPQLPILSQRWVIKAHGLSCPHLLLGDWRITKMLTCALHYHHIVSVLKVQDGNIVFHLFCFVCSP